MSEKQTVQRWASYTQGMGFKSDGPWNRICADCHHRIDESDEKERATRAGLSYQRTGYRRQSEGEATT